MPPYLKQFLPRSNNFRSRQSHPTCFRTVNQLVYKERKVRRIYGVLLLEVF
jgi:hypothetical protein